MNYELAPTSPFRRGYLRTWNSLKETIGQPLLSSKFFWNELYFREWLLAEPGLDVCILCEI
jgi:hypothetical protein